MPDRFNPYNSYAPMQPRTQAQIDFDRMFGKPFPDDDDPGGFSPYNDQGQQFPTPTSNQLSNNQQGLFTNLLHQAFPKSFGSGGAFGRFGGDGFTTQGGYSGADQGSTGFFGGPAVAEGGGGGFGGGAFSGGAGSLGAILGYILAGSYLQNAQDEYVKAGSTEDKLLEGFFTPNLSQGILDGRWEANAFPFIGPWLADDKDPDTSSDGTKLLGGLGFPTFTSGGGK